MKQKVKKQVAEGEDILFALRHVQMQLECARKSFELLTDENLIDSCIYEIISLQRKYAYFLNIARERGLTHGYEQVI